MSGAGGIVYGAATGGTGAVVVGSLLATQSLIFYIDHYRSSRDLNQYIGEQRSVWNTQKTELNNLIGEYRSEHENFLRVVGESTEQINTLKSLQHVMSEQHKIETERYEQQLANVQQRLETLSQLEERYRIQNEELSSSLHRATEQSQVLQIQNDELKATEDALKSQVVKLRDLHEQSKQLLKNLVLAGDAFTSFGKEFGSATERLDNTTDRVQEGVDDLQNTLALLKDVAEHLHTEHVRSLGAAFSQPPESAENSLYSSQDDVQSDVESFFDDNDDDEQDTELEHKDTENPTTTTTVNVSDASNRLRQSLENDWIPDWAAKAFYNNDEKQ